MRVAMKIQNKFQKLVKENRKLLLQAGYKAARLTLWAQGARHPSYEEAKKLARLLHTSVEDIAWVRWQRNS
jgi:hypothetical protein